MYCDSDQASLCWECDERVHSANFLVAKHSRNLLCHVCQSVTQWKASGSKFGPTFSLCQRCFNNQGSVRRDQEEEDQEAETTDRVGGDSDDEDEEYSDNEEEEDDDDAAAAEEEDGENQVVPWTTPSPPVATTSGSEIGSFSNRDAAVDSALKRFRENTFPDSEDEDDGCCSSQVNIAAGVTTTTQIIGRSVGRSQQRCDLEGKRVRRMDAASSFMRFQER